MNMSRLGSTLAGMALTRAAIWNLRRSVHWLTNPAMFVGIVIVLAGAFSVLVSRL